MIWFMGHSFKYLLNKAYFIYRFLLTFMHTIVWYTLLYTRFVFINRDEFFERPSWYLSY